ncbi:MAG: hypothetical protein WC952_12695 [Desulfobulbaceae bacterium]
MDERYVLDISEADKPAWWQHGDPVELPLVTGRHCYDYDMVMVELPTEMVERAYDCLLQWYADNRLMAREHLDESVCLPIGVDAADILRHRGVLRKKDGEGK